MIIWFLFIMDEFVGLCDVVFVIINDDLILCELVNVIGFIINFVGLFNLVGVVWVDMCYFGIIVDVDIEVV